MHLQSEDTEARSECCARWGWAVPNAAAIAAIVDTAEAGDCRTIFDFGAGRHVALSVSACSIVYPRFTLDTKLPLGAHQKAQGVLERALARRNPRTPEAVSKSSEFGGGERRPWSTRGQG